MCIVALVKPGSTVDDNTMHQMANCNRNGLGIGYVRTLNGVSDMVVEKGLFDSREWIEKLRVIQKAAPDSPIILHARIATLGKVSRDNCHPFEVKNGLLAHNGVLWHSYSGRGYEALKSDTREFAERMYNNLTYEDIMFDKKHIEDAIGHNKMTLLYKDKRYIILNEELGHWKDNVWYSNANHVNARNTNCQVCVY